MSQIPIYFFYENIDFTLNHIGSLRTWLKTCILNEKKRLKELNYIFCSDDYLLGLNQTYLSHNFYTDIITFDHSSKIDYLEGDVFISVERVKENAMLFETLLQDELHRVMVHGILHLCGINDSTEEEKEYMRDKENICLLKRSFK